MAVFSQLKAAIFILIMIMRWQVWHSDKQSISDIDVTDFRTYRL